MDFNIANMWPVLVTPAGTLVFLWLALARGWLHTDGEFQDRKADAAQRVTDLKESHTTALEQRDGEIKHLREVNAKAMDALEKIADAQEQSIKTTEIVKAVMQNLQSAPKPKNPTGPMEKVQA